MKIALLTSKNQWFEHYVQELSVMLGNVDIYFKHEELIRPYDIVFILSYHRIISEKYLNLNKHNIVIHESNLPEGKGWAPLFWQVLEGKNEITFSMFEAGQGVDDGDIYFQSTLSLTGYELNQELRHKQAQLIIEMCQEFIKNYSLYIPPKKQEGIETFYPKRSPSDSELDIHKSIIEQFNLLRIVDNDDYPAFFEIDGRKYVLKVDKG